MSTVDLDTFQAVSAADSEQHLGMERRIEESVLEKRIEIFRKI